MSEEEYMEECERKYIERHTTHIKGYTEEYVNNLQQTIEQEYSSILSENAELRIDKALSWTNRIIEIIKQQPSEDDTWILENLHSIKCLLQGVIKSE